MQLYLCVCVCENVCVLSAPFNGKVGLASDFREIFLRYFNNSENITVIFSSWFDDHVAAAS